jgi:hypothetical protein
MHSTSESHTQNRAHAETKESMKAGHVRWGWGPTGRTASPGVVGLADGEECDDVVLVAFRRNLTARMLLLKYKIKPSALRNRQSP